MKGRTTLTIAHRLSTIKGCKIVAFEGGKVVESGTHAVLLDKENSLYSKLWNSQFTETSLTPEPMCEAKRNPQDDGNSDNENCGNDTSCDRDDTAY